MAYAWHLISPLSSQLLGSIWCGGSSFSSLPVHADHCPCTPGHFTMAVSLWSQPAPPLFEPGLNESSDFHISLLLGRLLMSHCQYYDYHNIQQAKRGWLLVGTLGWNSPSFSNQPNCTDFRQPCKGVSGFIIQLDPIWIFLFHMWVPSRQLSSVTWNWWGLFWRLFLGRWRNNRQLFSGGNVTGSA